MQFIRKTLMPGLVCAILGVLWMAAADRARPATAVLPPAPSASPVGAVATNDAIAVTAERPSLVNVLRSLFVS